MNYKFKHIINYIFYRNSLKLGRWNIQDKPYLKADYANMDSCGDIICGKPEYYKNITNTKKDTEYLKKSN